MRELLLQLKHGSASDVGRVLERVRTDESLFDTVSSQLIQDQEVAGVEDPQPLSIADPTLFSRALAGRYKRQCSARGDSATSEENPPYPNPGSFTFTAPPPKICPSVLPVKINCMDWPVALDWRSDQYSSPDRRTNETSSTHMLGLDVPLHQSLHKNLASIRRGFLLQQSCLSNIFHCHDIEAFDNLFEPFKDDNSTIASPSRVCEVCAVAATSGQYVRELLPSGLLDYWYGKLILQKVAMRVFQGLLILIQRLRRKLSAHALTSLYWRL
jgi:hypothetical protein